MSLKVMIALVFLATQSACVNSRPVFKPSAMDSAMEVYSSCPPTMAPTGERFRARYGGFSVLLPHSSRRAHVHRDQVAIGENWTNPEGLEVSYRMYHQPLSSILDPDELQFECSELIGGRSARLRAFYSEKTYIPGQYVVAEWTMTGNRILTLTAVAPDSVRVQELMQIVRSVEFDR